MTAEVAMLNRMGVALAADSAVTIGSKATKIYTSADKLFQLSNAAPVGAMIYGSATLCGMPWETIIKAYRGNLGSKTFDRVADYADDILAFIRRSNDLMPEKLQRQHISSLLYSYFFGLQQALKKRFTESTKEKGASLLDTDLPPLVEEVVEMRRKWIIASEKVHGFPDDAKEKIREAFSAEIDGHRKKTLGDLPLSEDTAAKLHDMVIELLTRAYFGPHKCGLVVAGFGEKQYSPALIAFEMEGMVLGTIRKRVFSTYEVNEDSDGCILPFAQTGPVTQFLEGIDPETERFLHKTTATVVNGAIDILIQKLESVDQGIAQQISEAVRPEVGILLKNLFDGWSSHKQSNWGPIVNMVSALPKDELGAMCEAMVNLTKFRRRISPERETVGGPIDVAVITKGDGFVWLKRKHYFDPALNPRIMARYGKES